MVERIGDAELDGFLDEMRKGGYMTADDIYDIVHNIPKSRQDPEVRRIYRNYKNSDGE